MLNFKQAALAVAISALAGGVVLANAQTWTRPTDDTAAIGTDQGTAHYRMTISQNRITLGIPGAEVDDMTIGQLEPATIPTNFTEGTEGVIRGLFARGITPNSNYNVSLSPAITGSFGAQVELDDQQAAQGLALHENNESTGFIGGVVVDAVFADPAGNTLDFTLPNQASEPCSVSTVGSAEVLSFSGGGAAGDTCTLQFSGGNETGNVGLGAINGLNRNNGGYMGYQVASDVNARAEQGVVYENAINYTIAPITP